MAADLVERAARVTGGRAIFRDGAQAVDEAAGLAPTALLVELYTNHGAGTLVTREREVADAPELAETPS